MPHPLLLVDAFAAAHYSGNPAAVVLLDGPGELVGVDVDVPALEGRLDGLHGVSPRCVSLR